MGKAIEWKRGVFLDRGSRVQVLPLHGEGDRMETCRIG